MDQAALTEAAQKLAAQAQPASSGGSFLGMTFGGIMASLIFSGIGIIYLRYGKTSGSGLTMAAGIALMIYPYFVSSTLWIILAGLGIMLAHRLASS